MSKHEQTVLSSYKNAQELFAQWGVDTQAAIEALADMPVSIHCWQGDDVRGLRRLRRERGRRHGRHGQLSRPRADSRRTESRF